MVAGPEQAILVIELKKLFDLNTCEESHHFEDDVSHQWDYKEDVPNVA